MSASSDDLRALATHAAAFWNADPYSVRIIHVAHHATATFRPDMTTRTCYLRLSPQAHRSREAIEAELEFVTFLKSSRCDVAGPVVSTKGQLFHAIPLSDGDVYAVVFEEAPGEPQQWGADEHNRGILQARGAALGRIHRAAKSFRPKKEPRFHWREDELFRNPRQVLGSDDVMSEYEAVMGWLSARPSTAENYGMIHGDLGTSNCREQKGRVTLFDFDDCCHHWFAFDLAVAMWAGRQLSESLRASYLQCLLDAYATENSLAGDTCEEIGWFVRLATIYRYANAVRFGDKQQMQELAQQVRSPIEWC
jgi:Ser/Thr protein kinase RdoA (MazF antagonist)